MQRSVPALEVVGIRKSYGATVALDGVDLEVAAGTVLALLGPNGAGKTSLVSIVAGLRRADGGTVRVKGIDIARDPRAVRAHVGFAPQDTGVYPSLSVKHNLQFFAGLAGLRGRERSRQIDTVVAALGLHELIDRRASELSGGERRRLHTAIALVHRPALVLLDEPTTGADVRTRAEILDLVRGLALDGSAVVYSTHYLHEVEQLGARVVFMDRGRRRGARRNQGLGPSTRIKLIGALTFDGRIPAAAYGDGAIVEGSLVRIPTDDPARTAAELLPRLGPEVTALRAVEVIRPDLESVFLAVTGRRYDPEHPQQAA